MFYNGFWAHNSRINYCCKPCPSCKSQWKLTHFHGHTRWTTGFKWRNTCTIRLNVLWWIFSCLNMKCKRKGKINVKIKMVRALEYRLLGRLAVEYKTFCPTLPSVDEYNAWWCRSSSSSAANWRAKGVDVCCG